MTLDLTKPHKRVEFAIKISANRQSTINGGEEFFTMDSGGTAVGIFNFELEDENGEFKKLDLTGVKEVLIGFDFIVADSSVILEPEILDAENGRVALALPNQFEYSGTVLGYTYIIWEGGREQDGGTFQLTFTESWLDKELPEMEDFYVSRFEDLAEEIRRRVEEIKAEMDRDLKTVKQDITTAQSDINKIQSQIDDNDIVRKVELDSAGFGENNLIRNSSEPIVINPDGSQVSATRLIANNLQHGATYSLSCFTEFLRGTNPTSMFRLFTSAHENGVGGGGGMGSSNQFPQPVGEVGFTFTVPETSVHEFVHLVVEPVAVNQSQGHTLQISNLMLTKGTKPQPHRQADEDNTERLDNIETLKPITKRTVATFEGKVAGSDVENPHRAERRQTSPNLPNPTGSLSEFNQTEYERISKISTERVGTTSTVNPDAVVSHRFTFNIIEHLEHNYSTAIWQGHTALADKVRIARQIVKRIACVWDGFGMTNGVPWVRAARATSLSNWHYSTIHANALTQRISLTLTDKNVIDLTVLDDGTCRFLVHTAEGQNTPIGGATLTTEFVQFEVDVETTLASTDWSYSKAEIDNQLLRYLPLTGGTLTGNITTSGRYNSTANIGFLLQSSADNNSGLQLDFVQGNVGRVRLVGDNATDFRIANNAGSNIANFTTNIATIRQDLEVGRNVTAQRFIGNADTATQLQTARNLTVGNTTKSFNGTASVGWSLAEIGALASNGNAVSATRLANPRNFQLTGDVEGVISSDLSGNVTIPTRQRRLQATDWRVIDPRTLNLRRGDVVAIWGSGDATNQPLGTAGSAWAGELLCVNDSTSPRYILEVYTDHKVGARADYRNSAWSTWDRIPVTGMSSVVFDMIVTRANQLNTPRTFTVGNTSKAFDGTANVSWTLNEIGALATNGNAVSASRLATPRTINGKAFDGSTNINVDAQNPFFQVRNWGVLDELVATTPDRAVVRVASVTGSVGGPEGHVYLQGTFTRFDNNNGLIEVVHHENNAGAPIVVYYRRFGGGQWGRWYKSQPTPI